MYLFKLAVILYMLTNKFIRHQIIICNLDTQFHAKNYM